MKELASQDVLELGFSFVFSVGAVATVLRKTRLSDARSLELALSRKRKAHPRALCGQAKKESATSHARSRALGPPSQSKYNKVM